MGTVDSGAQPGGPPPDARARPGFGWIALGVVALAFLTHRYQIAIGLVGHDTLPVILTARVRSIADVLGLFAMKLMDDRFEQDYYRPILNLSVALDEQLYGLAARGFQVHSIAIFAAAAVALARLARQLLGPRAWIGPAVCGVVFTLHPSHVDVLPIVPRRHETLACLFAALALAALLSPRGLAKRGPPVLAGLWALLAMGSKETALAFPALACAAVFLRSPHAGWRARGRHALVATSPCWIALGVALAARFAVLGGMGGPKRHGAALHPRVAADILEGVLLPEALGRTLGLALQAAIAVALAGAWLASLASRDEARARWESRRFGGALSIAGLWMVGSALVHSLGGAHQPWYELLPLAGFALAAGSAVEALVATLRREARATEAARRRRVGAKAALGLLSVLLVLQTVTSPLVRRYPEWEQADQLGARYLARLWPLLDAAPPGSTVNAPKVPARVVGDRETPGVTDAAILTVRSVQAWTELEWPERRFRVVVAREATRARPGEVLVVLQGQKDVEAEVRRD